MNIVTKRLPSYIVPISEIEINSIKISSDKPARTVDDWGRSHYSGSILIEERNNDGSYGQWVYFHAILADSILPLYVSQTENRTSKPFELFDMEPEDEFRKKEILFNPHDVLPAVYLNLEPVQEVTYKKLYESYLKVSPEYKSALNNYFQAIDIGFNKRLGYIDVSYWTIVMLISALESFLPKPDFCDGVCETCGRKVHHSTKDPNIQWNNLIFNHIKSKKVSQQYRDILDAARWKIRNNTVHNGLMPLLERASESLPDGVTEITASKAVKSYLTDKTSLDSLIDHLHQICRYVLLNELTTFKIFPELVGIVIHSKTVTVTTSSAEILLDF